MEFTTTREVLASLFHESPTAMLLCEREGRIVAANRAAEQLTGYASQRLTGRTCGELTGGTRLDQAVRAALSGESDRFEADLHHHDAHAVRVECEVFPARIAGGVAGAFVQVSIAQTAFNDALTGLPNRVLLADRLEQTLMTARRYRYAFAVMCGDLDRFREINERIGHYGGDEALRVVARRIRETLRGSDTVAHIGGGEFVVLQPVIEGPDDAIDLASKIVFGMQAPVAVEGHSFDLGMTLGIAIFPADGESGDELMAAAVLALAEAKRSGRGTWRLATSSAMERAT
ncbi:MAG TPA: diguanylate cyclase [Candidatus Tyrphobacter sp.]